MYTGNWRDEMWANKKNKQRNIVDGLIDTKVSYKDYCNHDVASATKSYEDQLELYGYRKVTEAKIAKVIFNKPATIVIWSDGVKTVVKAQKGDKFDPEKGLAMAITKRVFGNKGSFNNEFRKWIK